MLIIQQKLRLDTITYGLQVNKHIPVLTGIRVESRYIMNELNKYSKCFLYAVELWAQNVLNHKLRNLKVDYYVNVDIYESCDGNIWFTIDDGEEHTQIIGNTGNGCMHEKPFSGIDNIFDNICNIIDNYCADI